MEALMQRARLALGAGLPAPDVVALLTESGVHPNAAFLAVCAGEILLRDDDQAADHGRGRQCMVTAPSIPALKRGQ